MKDIALTAAEAKETMLGCSEAHAPKYPWGTSLEFDDETLEKLGITQLPDIGEEVAITAVAKVTRISASEDQDGARRCLGLQITLLDVNIPSQVLTPANKLYKNGK